MQIDATGLTTTITIPSTQTGSIAVSAKVYAGLRDANLLQPVGSVVGANFTVNTWGYALPNNMYQCYLITGESVGGIAVP